jgi:uncharacterized membrane protein YphA (DoxX/SURF4 family)
MNSLLWIAQILLAAIFLFTGASKLFAYEFVVDTVEARSAGLPAGVTRGLAALIGLAEIAGALGVVTPGALTPGVLGEAHLLVRLAAGGLALIMVLAGIYHIRREDSAAPSVSLFLLALFVIVGRWPR